MNKLRVIFVGIPDMAIVCLDRLLKENFQIVGVIPPQKDNDTYNFFKEFVEAKNLNLIEFDKSPNEVQCINRLKELNADVGVVCSYNQKLSPDFLNTTKIGYINSHPSLLPDYRGGMPYFHTIKNNESISGITLHFMDENFDTGDIVYQEKLELLPCETMGTLFNRTNFMMADALVKVLKELEESGKLKTYKQSHIKSTKIAKSINGCFKINWKNDIDEIDALIRACNPFYTAYSYFRGQSLKIVKAEKIIKKHNFEFGKITKATRNEILVAAKNGFLSLKILQMGTWGIFEPDTFYNFFIPTDEEYLT